MKIGQFILLNGTNNNLEDNQNIRNIGKNGNNIFWGYRSSTLMRVYWVDSLTGTTQNSGSISWPGNIVFGDSINSNLKCYGEYITHGVIALNTAASPDKFWFLCLQSNNGGSSFYSYTKECQDIISDTISDGKCIDVMMLGGLSCCLFSYEDATNKRVAIFVNESLGEIYEYTTYNIDNIDSVYGGYINSDGDYVFIIYDDSGDFYVVTYDQSAKTFSESALTGSIIAPISWNVNTQQYWVQGNQELIMDQDHLYYRIIGTSIWSFKSDTGTITNGIVWGYNDNGKYIIKYIIWKDTIYKISGGGKIDRLQTYTGDAYVGIDDWFSNGSDEIWQLAKVIEKEGEIITFVKSNVIAGNYKAPSGSFTCESESSIWNEKDLVMIFDDKFTTNDDLVLIGLITFPEGFEGELNQIKVTSPINEDLRQKVNESYPIGTKCSTIINEVIPKYCSSLFLGIINNTDTALTFAISFKKDVKDVLIFCDQQAKFQGRINPDWSLDWDNGEAATGIVLTDDNNIELKPKPNKVKVTSVNVIGGIKISTGLRVNITVVDETDVAGVSITIRNTSLITDAAAESFGDSILASSNYTIMNYKSDAWNIELAQVGLRLSMASAIRGLSAANYHINYSKRDLINGKNHLVYSNVRQYLIDPDEDRSKNNEQMIEDNAVITNENTSDIDDNISDITTLENDKMDDLIDDETPQLYSDLDLNDNNIVINKPSADHKSEGIIHIFISNGVTIGHAVYVIPTTGRVAHCNESSSSTFPAIGIAMATVSAGSSVKILLHGIFRDDSWNWATSLYGRPLYPTSTNGTLSTTRPSTIGDQVQRIGIVLDDDHVFINPSPDVLTED